MAYTNYTLVVGTIMNISRGNDCLSQMVSLRTGNGIVNFVVSSRTQVIENRQLRVGMRVGAYYDSALPVPLIFPPQYQAQIITEIGRNELLMLNYFDRDLLASDASLQLNVAGNTKIRTLNGQRFDCSLGNRTLLVYYTATTRSIPPQTTPEKIIVL